MPTFQFEAMDKTGQEVRDVIEAANQEEAQATIRQRGLFVTKIGVKKARKGKGEKAAGAEEGQDLRPGRRQFQGAHHLHPPVGHPPGGRPAHPPQPEDPGAAVQAGRPEELADRRLRRDRKRLHALRGHGQVAQGLQPPVRQHDQGRRGGRGPGNHLEAPGRVPGTRPVAQTQGPRGHDLPGLRRALRREHPGLHHVEDRAPVREDLQGLRHQAARHHADADQHLGAGWAGGGSSSRPSPSATGCTSSSCENSPRGGWAGTSLR